MAYHVKNKKSGKAYYLHAREQELKNGHKQRLFFFAQKEGPGALDQLPDGYAVAESERTGLPILRKAGKTGNERS